MYDGERYEQVRRIAAEMLADPDQLDANGVEGLFASQVRPRDAEGRRARRRLPRRRDPARARKRPTWAGRSPAAGPTSARARVRPSSGRSSRSPAIARSAVKLIGLYERDRHADRRRTSGTSGRRRSCASSWTTSRLPLGAETTAARLLRTRRAAEPSLLARVRVADRALLRAPRRLRPCRRSSTDGHRRRRLGRRSPRSRIRRSR